MSLTNSNSKGIRLLGPPRGIAARYMTTKEKELRAPPPLNHWSECERHSCHFASGYSCPICEKEADERVVVNTTVETCEDPAPPRIHKPKAEPPTPSPMTQSQRERLAWERLKYGGH